MCSGVFTLLETPQILIETSPAVDDADGDYVPYYQNVADIRLTSPLKYAINPAAGLAIKDFAVSFVIEGCNEGVNNQVLNLSDTSLTSPGITIILPDFDVVPPYVKPAAYVTPSIPLDCAVAYSARLQRGGFGAFGSQFGDISCISSVKLRISLTLGRSEDDPFSAAATDDEFVQLSFEADETIIPYNEPRPNPSSFFADLPLNRKVENLSLTDDLTLYAWNQIEVGNGIETNGFQLTLIAGREIIVPPDVFTPADVDLLIGLPPGCEVVPPQTEEEICEFCNDTYDAIAALRHDEPAADDDSGACLKVWPNPVSAQAQLAFTVKESRTDVRLQLHNNLGQRVGDWLLDQRQQGMHTIPLDISTLRAGVYHLQYSTNEQQCVTTLVKQ